MKRKIKNKINGVVAVVWFLSAASVDSESWLPIILCAASTIWLALFLDAGKKCRGGERHAADR